MVVRAVTIVFDGREAKRSFNGSDSVGSVFTYAASHLSTSRHTASEDDYTAYIHGQRVPFSTTLDHWQATELVFLRRGELKKEEPSQVDSSPSVASPALVPARRRSRVASLIEAALVKSEAELDEHAPSRPQPAAEVVEISDDDASDASGSDTESDDVAIPVVIGSVVQWLGPRSADAQTHQWSVYVRGHNNEDLSGVIEAVEFRLHESFPDPVRVIRKSPFEVAEVGWGQFTIGVRVHVRGVTGPAGVVSTTHFLAFNMKGTPIEGRPVSPPPAAIAVGNRPHSVPPHGHPLVKAPDTIPPFAVVKAPAVVERADELVVRHAPAELREAAAKVAKTAGQGGLSCWRDIKAHLALPAGAEWLDRVRDVDREVEELTDIRDALAAELTRALRQLQQQQAKAGIKA